MGNNKKYTIQMYAKNEIEKNESQSVKLIINWHINYNEENNAKK
jgi:hypothetical protein